MEQMTMNRTDLRKENLTGTPKKKSVGFKVLYISLAVLLMIGISAVVATIIHKNSGSVPVSSTIENGLSAYEVAVKYGYDGSVQDWLGSLSGKSAYEIAKENGYTGTEKEWAAALNAAANQTKSTIKSASFSSDGELLITLSDDTVLNLGVAVGKDGKNGINGQDGKDGKDGINGKDSVSVTSASVNTDGQLVMNFSDGSSVNLDRVVGMNGSDGVSITKSEINADGELELTYSNGQKSNLGVVIGANGTDGKDGQNGINGKDGANGTNGIDGKDGISITNSVVNASGELVLTYSDGSSANLGTVIGTNGTNGKDGIDGQDGKDGTDGISVTSAEINSDGELVLAYSNGQRSNLGCVIGANGTNGTDGANGKDGVNGTDGIGVAKSEINSNGELVLTYTDGAVDNLGVVIGAKGEKGEQGIQGIQGDKGETGAAGQNGSDGKDGVGIENISVSESGELEITLSSGTTLNLGTVKGADGKNGLDGKDGQNGMNGTDGKDGIDGIGVTKTEVNSFGELVISYSDGTSVNLGRVVGEKGEQGVQGEAGADGQNGTDGANGIDGKDGIGIAKTEINEQGQLIITYTDDTTVNLGIIVGADGKDGVNGKDGENGADGTDGKDGLNGADGKDGIGISNVVVNADNELVLTFSDSSSINLGCIVGKDGKDGINGQDGKDGTNGVDGVGISNVSVSAEGALTMTLTNGTVLNLGNIKGESGIGIAKSEINANGELLLTYSNGDVSNLGVVVGTNGTNGVNGTDGVGIKTVTLSTDGDLSILMTDNSVYNLGNIKGEKGEKGDTGAQGEKGDKGDPGVDGKDGRGIDHMELVDGELVVTYTDGTTQNLGNISGSGTSEDDSPYIFELVDENSYGVKAKEGFDLTIADIPSIYRGKPVTEILENGFKEISTIESVIIPNSVKKIGNNAFSATSLKSVVIPASVERICAYAFYSCPLEKVSFVNSGKWRIGETGTTYFPYTHIVREYTYPLGMHDNIYMGRPQQYSDATKFLSGSVRVLDSISPQSISFGSEQIYRYTFLYFYNSDWIYLG